MWEIFSLAKSEPYPNISNSEFMQNKDKIFEKVEEMHLPQNGSTEV